MPDTIKPQPPVDAKPAAAVAPKPAIVTAPKVADAKPADVKPVATAKPAESAKPAVKPIAKAAQPAAPAKRKPGRPAGSKTVKAAAPKPVAAPKPTATPKVVTAKPAVAKPAPVAAAKPIPVTTKPVAPLAVATSEGSRTMNDTIVKMQDTAKKFTGEATARAKGAYEKSVKLTEEMTEFQKGNVEAIVESSKLAAKAVETLGQEAADYARKSFENGTAAFKGFASAKSPTELFKLQSDYAKSYFDSMIAESSKVTEAWLKITGEVVQPLSNRVALAVDKVKAAAAF